MAAPKRQSCCLPDGQTLRFPSVNAESLPNKSFIFKAKMHDDLVAMFNENSTFCFDDESLRTGVIKLQGESYPFEALPAAVQPGNPMDLLLSINDNTQLSVEGSIKNNFAVDRTKLNPSARRRRTCSPSKRKRNVHALDENTNGLGASAENGTGLKRQRVSGINNGSLSVLRSSKPGTRPTSALNGLGASSPFQSPHVSPDQGASSGVRSKSRSSTPPDSSHNRSQGTNARTTTSPTKSSSPGSSSGVRISSAERERKLRHGIIHVLALQVTPKDELRRRCFDSRETPNGERSFWAIVKKVSKSSKAGYTLNEECWDEVSEDCALYSEADRKRLSEVLAKRNKASSGLILRTARGSKRGEAPMIVNDYSSHKTISQALERFDNRQKLARIRNAKEEEEARSIFRAYHSVYEQVNKRMDMVRVAMAEFHTRYNEASSPREQMSIAEKIQSFYSDNLERHAEYMKYLPLLHKELKMILERLENFSA